MRCKPWLVVVAALSAVISSWLVAHVLFPEAVAHIGAELNGEAAAVIWIAFILAALAGMGFLRSNKKAVEKVLSGQADSRDLLGLWVRGKPTEGTEEHRRI